MRVVSRIESNNVKRSPESPAVLSVAFPYAPVGPRAVGGAEVICSQVESEVSSYGFASVVVAHADSSPHGRLYGTKIPEGTITEETRTAVETAHQANIDRALAENAVVLVHMHGLDFHRYRLPEDLPVLVTLHLPPSWYPEVIWHLASNYHLLCVSESQRQACPSSARERILVIENGVSLPPQSSLRAEGRYALLLARICAEKNLHTGLDAAKLAGMPSILGGDVFPYAAHQDYFEQEIKPRLTSRGVVHEGRNGSHDAQCTARFVGPVHEGEKARLLSRAACLLLPSLAPETSSLVAMEALASGVPVVGMAVGAVPGIIEHGKTGFLVQPGAGAMEEMAAAIRRVPTLSRAVCRSTAEVRFPLDRMLARYGELYRHLALPVAGALRRPAAPPGDGEPKQVSFAADDLVTEEITTDEALQSLEPAWANLWLQDATATPFQHPGWLLPWWRQFGPEGRLRALALRLRADRTLVGFVPLYVYTDLTAKRSKLLLAGAGTSDYLDGVWAAEREVLGTFVTEPLREESSRWDECSLEQLREDSPLALAAAGLGVRLAEAEALSELEVGAALPPKLRANLGRYRRRAEAHGPLRFEVAQSMGDALAGFEDLVRFHRLRWEGRGQAGVLRDPRVRAHHREAIPRLLDAGILRILRLVFGEETVSILYAMADAETRAERRLYLYLIGFEQRFAELSPGTLLLHEVWRYARENGFHKLDLLRGGEAYKELWGAESRTMYALRTARAVAPEGGC